MPSSTCEPGNPRELSFMRDMVNDWVNKPISPSSRHVQYGLLSCFDYLNLSTLSFELSFGDSNHETVAASLSQFKDLSSEKM